MIFDTLENLPKYVDSIPGLEEVIRCLKEENLASKPVGSYATNDARCRYNITEYETSESQPYEKHRFATDVQVMLKGSEKMGFSTDTECDPFGEYDAQKDISFSAGKDLVTLTASGTFFVVFFAGEAHRPGLPFSRPEKVKKVIFKLHTDGEAIP